MHAAPSQTSKDTCLPLHRRYPPHAMTGMLEDKMRAASKGRGCQEGARRSRQRSLRPATRGSRAR
eukprot:1858207-Pleurochrysis_carterae.AAC.3